MRQLLAILLAILLALVIGAPPVIPQDVPSAQDRPIKVQVQFVDVHVTVTDDQGKLISSLERENFRVFEDGEEQEVVHFGRRDAPLAAGILIDTSGSMVPKMDKAVRALERLITIAGKGKDDEFFLVAFTEEGQATFVSHFTTAAEVQAKTLELRGGGETPLFDGIYHSSLELKARIKWESQQGAGTPKKKHALVIISDGGDNNSHYSKNDIKDVVRELDAQIYGIGIYEPNGYHPTDEEEKGPALLREIAEMTGGYVRSVEKLDDIPAIATEIGSTMKEQYYIQYRPMLNKKKLKKDGKCPDYRKIEVRINPPKGMPDLRARTRTGYCNQ